MSDRDVVKGVAPVYHGWRGIYKSIFKQPCVFGRCVVVDVRVEEIWGGVSRTHRTAPGANSIDGCRHTIQYSRVITQYWSTRRSVRVSFKNTYTGLEGISTAKKVHSRLVQRLVGAYNIM